MFQLTAMNYTGVLHKSMFIHSIVAETQVES